MVKRAAFFARRLAMGLALLGCVVGCSRECPPQMGSFAMHSMERPGGTCGHLYDGRGTYFAPDGFVRMETESCSGNGSQPHCTTQYSIACSPNPSFPPPYNTISITESAAITWSVNSPNGVGILQRHVAGGGQECSSTYDVTYARQ